jgi:serine/threonine protein phosphatase 1
MVKPFLDRLLGRAPEKSRQGLPEGARLYAVGDIHGRLDCLDALLEKIEADARSAPAKLLLVFVGDYVDRGPQSKGVVERVMEARDGFEIHRLRGNHDEAVLQFLADPGFFPVWRSFGGLETLLSYGVRPPRLESPEGFNAMRADFRAALPPSHLAFFAGLEPSFTFGGYFFAHAGGKPGVALDRQDIQDLMWIRDEFLASDAAFGKIVVHGHTPSERPIVRANRIGIDTGAYATGVLTAVVLEGINCRFLSSGI